MAFFLGGMSPPLSPSHSPLRPAYSSPEEVNDILNDDLAMTTKALKVHPKIYWIWNHRRWCLEHIPENPDSAESQSWRRSTWERELFIVEKMLEADSRNCPSFLVPSIHSLTLGSLFIIVLACDYRRYVLASMPVRRSEKAELAYTTKRIEANFSNFSAWHQRTKVLSSLWANGEVDRTSSLQKGIDSPASLSWSRMTDIFHTRV
jgi:geranylgeranyl transferase type-2 subunit alpha